MVYFQKNSNSALYKRGNLNKIDNTSLDLPADTKLYINENLCPPLKFLHYKVRQLFKRKCIYSHNLWKEQLPIKMKENGDNISVSHINNLSDLGLVKEDELLEFATNY